MKKSIIFNIIFDQERVGRYGKLFKIHKFRTMRLSAKNEQKQYWYLNEAEPPVFKIRNDPRFTRFGKWLAWSGLDELPQIINILGGEMSLVGPRPLIPNEEKRIPKKWRFKRRSVKPGLTSSWFIKGAHKLSFAEWMELDMVDIRQKSFWYDAGIVLKTILAVAINIANLAFTAVSSAFCGQPLRRFSSGSIRSGSKIEEQDHDADDSTGNIEQQ